MFRGTEDKLKELRRELAHLGLRLDHLSGSRKLLAVPTINLQEANGWR